MPYHLTKPSTRPLCGLDSQQVARLCWRRYVKKQMEIHRD